MNIGTKRGRLTFVGVLLTAIAFAGGCGKDEAPKDTNLLTNGSFEQVEGNIPVGWELNPFRGMEGSREAEYGIDTAYPFDGENSFFFKADAVTRRFFTLSQEVEVKDVERIKLRGAVRSLDVRRDKQQYPQANLALTYYDQDRNRFYSSRFYDKRTRPRLETSDDWISEELIVRLPENTAYIVVHCALGMTGTVWYDDISLEIPTDIGWNTSVSKNFTFHWTDQAPYPDGSREYQQQLFDNYATRLGIPEVDRPHIYHFLYPDSLSIYQAIGTKEPKKSYWDSQEVHSIYPVDDHEIIHVMTFQYGVLPFGLSEGTAFYLIGEYKGHRLERLAYDLLQNDRLPTVRSIVDPTRVRQMNPDIVIPAAATYIGFLLEFGGTDRFLDFHIAANNMLNYEEYAAAFVKVYEKTPEETDVAWRKILGGLQFPDSAHTETQEE
ncbi:MAG: hypothetical protein JSW50_01850 [Candidatus Latescibacterota bacterium]|nr:MAG: hypothetical protein JSW50_01850 [Candidatus Latescibacterota bacterium]